MTKKSKLKYNLKATGTTVTTAGILLTSVQPSYTEEQQLNVPIQQQPSMDEMK
ncbi:hypothetical protein [Bacillus cereus group sp. RP43]|uniref:hypothetical protein n=1 Tax=Bacillus cereus group sp. RP43 TaxID=3040260 RepID=UPI0033934641